MGIFTKKLKEFAVELDEEKPISAGETVKGRVVIELNEPMKMRGVHIEFLGYGWTRFEKFNDYATWGMRRGYHDFSSRQDYYKLELILLGKEMGKILGDNTVLEAGRHEYPFEFVLPENVPPSAEFRYGGIRHQLKATIDRPWKFDHILRKPFTVQGVLDLNDTCYGPFSERKTESLGCVCCPSGSITMDLQLPRTGYVPGEYILFKGTLKNESSRRIKPYIFRLRQNVAFSASYPGPNTHRTTSICAEVKRKKGVQPFQTLHLDTEAFLVPPLPATKLGGCTIMDCNYILEVLWGKYVRIEVPLTIGTVPPRDAATVFSNEPYNPDWYNPKVPIEFPPPSTFNPTPADEAPPPSYCQAVFEKPAHDYDAEEDKGAVAHHSSDPWAPSYNYYNWN